MNEKQIQAALKNSSYDCEARIPNIYFNGIWEADLLVITRSWQTVEYEIKCSKQDFLADFKKEEKHNYLSKLFDTSLLPNYFHYVCPEGLIELEDVPEYAGLIYIKQYNLKRWTQRVKSAPVLHKDQISEECLRSLVSKLADRL